MFVVFISHLNAYRLINDYISPWASFTNSIYFLYLNYFVAWYYFVSDIIKILILEHSKLHSRQCHQTRSHIFYDTHKRLCLPLWLKKNTVLQLECKYYQLKPIKILVPIKHHGSLLHMTYRRVCEFKASHFRINKVTISREFSNTRFSPEMTIIVTVCHVIVCHVIVSIMSI